MVTEKGLEQVLYSELLYAFGQFLVIIERTAS